MNLSTQQLSLYEFEIFKQFSSHDILPIANQWKDKILSNTSAIDVQITGELRRGKASLSHIDLVVSTDNIPLTINEICGLTGTFTIKTKSRNFLEILVKNKLIILVWLTIPSEFPFAVLFTTGPVTHTDWLDQIAFNQNKRLSFHGCWKNKQSVQIGSEQEIYQFLGLPFITPEIRERNFSQNASFVLSPHNLITHSDIRSDLHVHSNWSDGKNTIEEMICAAIIRGLSSIAITDHSPLVLKPRYTNSKYFLSQHEEIDGLINKYRNQITILKGVEVDILPDGSLDLPEELLRSMDIVIASLHVHLDQKKSILTDRLIRAIENPFVDVIGHPGGRLYPMHDIADLDWERVFQAAAFHQVAMEINSHKAHPLFDDRKVSDAINVGVPICLNSDAHSASMLDQSIFGINIARRAGLDKKQIINTWSPSRLKIWLDRKKSLHRRGKKLISKS